MPLLTAEGRSAEVEDVLRDAARDLEKFLTPTHPATLAAKVRLSDWLVEQGRVEKGDAPNLLEGCRQLADHEDASQGRRQLAIETAIKLCQVMNQAEELNAWRERLAELDES